MERNLVATQIKNVLLEKSEKLNTALKNNGKSISISPEEIQTFFDNSLNSDCENDKKNPISIATLLAALNGKLSTSLILPEKFELLKNKPASASLFDFSSSQTSEMPPRKLRSSKRSSEEVGVVNSSKRKNLANNDFMSCKFLYTCSSYCIAICLLLPESQVYEDILAITNQPNLYNRSYSMQQAKSNNSASHSSEMHLHQQTQQQQPTKVMFSQGSGSNSNSVTVSGSRFEVTDSVLVESKDGTGSYIGRITSINSSEVIFKCFLFTSGNLDMGQTKI